MKDFYDTWLLSRQFDFDGATLTRAVTATFANRKTTMDPKPVALTPTFSESPVAETQWRAFVRKGKFAPAPEHLSETVAAVAEFRRTGQVLCGPVLAGTNLLDRP
jgi:hypothetical protein